MERSAVACGCILAVLGALGLSGCQTAKPAPIEVIAGTDEGADVAYLLQVGDTVAVHFFAYPDLDDTAPIGPDGHVSLRFIGDFKMSGMTLSEATKAVNDQYHGVLRHPEVTLAIKNYALQQVYVSGEVGTPGVIRSTIPLTVSGAIAQAGGLKLASANSHGALLLRRRPDGAIVYYKLGLRGDLPGGNFDPILHTNDVVYVPRTAIAAVADFVQNNITRIVPFSASYSWFHQI